MWAIRERDWIELADDHSEEHLEALLLGQYEIGSRAPQFWHAYACGSFLSPDRSFELLCYRLAS